MSVACGLECVLCVGCTRWAWKRITYHGAYDSESWPEAEAGEFAAVPRMCRLIVAVYDPNLPAGDGFNPDWVVRRVGYDEIGSAQAAPYIVYADHANKEIVVAVRGLEITRYNDYKVLLDSRPDLPMFDGGYVHHGLLTGAKWILERETETIQDLLRKHGKEYRLVFAGHSLGSGIVSLMTMLVVNGRSKFDGIQRKNIHCYAIAPARCMSLNLAVKYADVITSIILQDDFLPRTPTPLQYIFGSIFCLPCLLLAVCLRDTFECNNKRYKNPRRLYAPGRIYHIVERKFCRCGRFPPVVRTAIPVENRFEHIVLSLNTTSDHALNWIESESRKALELMEAAKAVQTTPPRAQKFEREQSLKQEHTVAIEHAVSLDVPHVVPHAEEEHEIPISASAEAPASSAAAAAGGRSHWDAVVEKLFTRSRAGHLEFAGGAPNA